MREMSTIIRIACHSHNPGAALLYASMAAESLTYRRETVVALLRNLIVTVLRTFFFIGFDSKTTVAKQAQPIMQVNGSTL